jgi:hypothetical protein
MIQEFVDRYMAGQDALRAKFAANRPDEYADIVKAVVETITGDGRKHNPDPERIHKLDDGDYQGTLVFVIAAKGYQPSDYWYVKVGYGSCSGCDTLESLRSWGAAPPDTEELDGYMTLALHIVQRMKQMDGEEV